ncbi:MAG: DUF2306 domain-containing protein [Rhodobacteraceae bacterium]|nr:DUF2306 domain-containing protein [Paracoccaceae bacterium]
MIGHLTDRRTMFIAHISGASIALVIGGYQFFPKMRNKHRARHRWLGRVYGISILIGGVSGFFIAFGVAGGPIAASGFAILAVLWLFTTGMAVRFAMRREISDHRHWMIRSFALTFAAVTLRIYLLFFMVADFTYTEASLYIAWMCWVPNLIFAEWWLRRKG